MEKCIKLSNKNLKRMSNFNTAPFSWENKNLSDQGTYSRLPRKKYFLIRGEHKKWYIASYWMALPFLLMLNKFFLLKCQRMRMENHFSQLMLSKWSPLGHQRMRMVTSSRTFQTLTRVHKKLCIWSIG